VSAKEVLELALSGRLKLTRDVSVLLLDMDRLRGGSICSDRLKSAR
jgi:hypothetical protein